MERWWILLAWSCIGYHRGSGWMLWSCYECWRFNSGSYVCAVSTVICWATSLALLLCFLWDGVYSTGWSWTIYRVKIVGLEFLLPNPECWGYRHEHITLSLWKHNFNHLSGIAFKYGISPKPEFIYLKYWMVLILKYS